MRLFALIGALLIAAGAYLLVDAGLRLSQCLQRGFFSFEVWQAHFWLLVPGDPGGGLSDNAQWFLRLGGGLLVLALGSKILKVATR